jgi:hypothetical protein
MIKSLEIPSMLLQDSRLNAYIDHSIDIPQVYRGKGNIRLIVLGQDPTVKNAISRKKITTMLNLDKSGSLTNYLKKVCDYLDVDLSGEVYATNLFKNFFVQSPTTIKEIDIFQEFLPHWLPVLLDELSVYPKVPVLSLGEPLLSTLVLDKIQGKVRNYWGYTPLWKTGIENLFNVLHPDENVLGRIIFPFPHQPSWQRKKFYSDRLERYSNFIKTFIPERTSG